MSWYWKDVSDLDAAEDATKAAIGISYFVAALTGLLAILSLIYRRPMLGVTPLALVDAILFVVIGWRISKMSRTWAVVGLALYVLEAIGSVGARGTGIGVLTIVFTIAYVNAVRGVFAYHKHALASESASPEPLNPELKLEN